MMDQKFWSDDFDMDLLKVFPDTPKMLTDPDRVLWTVCSHLTHGRINCPSSWNGCGALLWLEKPNLQRNDRGWFNVNGLVSDCPEVECTWLEWLRDAFVHGHETLLVGFNLKLPAVNWADFQAIMYDLRGFSKVDTSRNRNNALQWMVTCDLILRKAAA